MNAITFTPESLPHAVASLFRLNHYVVEGPLQIHGAEIDLVARPLADPFSAPVYIEVTIEYVDNEKYGKDLTKLMMIREKDPGAQLAIVSSSGFSVPVRERAAKTRITTFTYSELFKKFERFDGYVEAVISDTPLASELRTLNGIYEEPQFVDDVGVDKATEYLLRWRDSTDASNRWLVIVGEYGTGKTALTKVLHYRWLHDYKMNPSLPIPFRIELRDFARQFDARGLLHHFLDRNGLAHVSVEFVESLIRSGKIVLLLDGYDEMAQYLHARERRACLEALAQLSSGGAKGILTSRPNYFTETEELQVFEILYASIAAGNYHLGKQDRELLKREEQVDQLLGQFIDRYERRLEDLTPVQTRALVKRALSDDPVGRQVVEGILDRVFRSIDSGDKVSLSGKPVIITYLLAVVEDLKNNYNSHKEGAGDLTEWEVYKLIVDQLMLRDFRRSPEMSPDDRRRFLQRLAIVLSRAETPTIKESEFKELVSKQFSQDLRRFPAQDRPSQVDRLFSDLRASATLTRAGTKGEQGWRFSHNSLREYLVAEHLVRELAGKAPLSDQMPITDAMRLFVASKPREEVDTLVRHIGELWPQRLTVPQIGQYLSLLWSAMIRYYAADDDPSGMALRNVCGSPIALNGVELSRMVLSSERKPACLRFAKMSSSTLATIDMTSADLRDVDFTSCVLESVNFSNADLHGAIFRGAMLIDVSFSGAVIHDADFRGVQPQSLSIIVESNASDGERANLLGENALGYLAFNGAITDKLAPSAIARHHPKYPIVEKILIKLCEQSLRQRRGLAQRGAARQDTQFAQQFVNHLVAQRLIHTPMNRKDMVEVAELGRERFARFAETREIPPEVIGMLLPEKR